MPSDRTAAEGFTSGVDNPEATSTGDGKSDVIWRNTAGETWTWLLNGYTTTGGGFLANLPSPPWTLFPPP